MHNFTLQPIEEFETKQSVFKLLRNGKCHFDKFFEEISIDKNLAPELGDLFAIIRHVANDSTSNLPPTKKYRKLNLGSKLKYNAYEAKSDHLRLYLIQERGTGLIFILGGKKKNQTRDLEHLKSLIKEFSLFRQKNK